jgi:citrate lyase subunit beta/citryl-CoA lyase
MDKARNLNADAIVFDLEDAVAPEAKAAAREMAVAQVAGGGYGQRQLIVRCNSLESPWGEDDLRLLATSPVESICLPKVETVAQLRSVRTLLDGLDRADIKLWAMIETPLGVSNADQLANFESLTTLVMGTTDLASELRVPHRADRIGLQYSLGRCVLAARARGKAILDGVYLNLADDPGLQAICEQGRALGFDGKTLIHPKQIEAANAAFGFSAEDLAHARKVLEVWQEAEAAAKGVALLDGKLVEVMHVSEATRLLEQAEWMSLETTS